MSDLRTATTRTPITWTRAQLTRPRSRGRLLGRVSCARVHVMGVLVVAVRRSLIVSTHPISLSDLEKRTDKAAYVCCIGEQRPPGNRGRRGLVVGMPKASDRVDVIRAYVCPEGEPLPTPMSRIRGLSRS